MKPLLVAYGNELRGDDGAAWELARRAEARGWPTLCTIQLTPELVERLNGLTQVVFVDATRESGPPALRPLDSHHQRGWPMHCAEPGRLLALCRELHGQAPCGWVLSLPGEDFGYRLGLSEPCLASVVQGLRELEELLSA